MPSQRLTPSHCCKGTWDWLLPKSKLLPERLCEERLRRSWRLPGACSHMSKWTCKGTPGISLANFERRVLLPTKASRMDKKQKLGFPQDQISKQFIAYSYRGLGIWQVNRAAQQLLKRWTPRLVLPKGLIQLKGGLHYCLMIRTHSRTSSTVHTWDLLPLLRVCRPEWQ